MQQQPTHPDQDGDLGLCLPSAPLLTTWSLLANGTARIRLAGELDLATISALDEAVAHCLTRRPPALDIDVAALSFCDVIGIHAFLRARHAAIAARAVFCLSRPRDQLVRTIVAARASELLAPDLDG
ncbi:STAS domain-containing protein [Kitasatospora sp. NPDC085879]|uniref:STAS domain-containing protein n=1 Tax=Kitasatospora sp. NPDC085879 TaxID=3154769 RepID=UPI00342819E6